MKIYNYNSTTGEYINTTDAIESPLEKGIYLIPAYATELVPPSATKNQVAIFNNNAWSLEADYRTQVYYDSNDNYKQITIDFIGDLPSNYVDKIPDNILAQQKTNQANNSIKNQIKALEYNSLRALREAILTGDNTYLKNYDSQIAELRIQLSKTSS